VQLHALWIMSELFNRLSRSSKLNASEPAQIFELVREYIPKLQQLPKMVKLERGVATVPLSGIDIPFHSKYLRGGIDSYRKFLLRTISEHDIDPRKLVGKFIPNVMGSPFSTGPGYIEKVSEVTGSMLLKSLILQVRQLLDFETVNTY
jgi:fatty acid synthase subunit beta, fungi type